MLKSLPITLLVAGVLTLGQSMAQQTPAASNTQSSGQTPSTPAKKPASTTAKKPTTSATKPASTLTLKTDKEKESYAFGMSVGNNLARQVGTSVDPAIAARGFKDALAGARPQIAPEEMQSLLNKLRGQVMQQMEAKAKTEGEPHRKEGEAFLAQNKSKEGIVALPDGLQYKILKEGTGPKPTANDTVKCNYKGTLLNGTEFDNSDKHGGAATFPLGGVIKGWTEALQLMPVGSKWQLFIPANLAYGDRPPGNEIPPGSTLVFEVELLSIEPQNK